MLILALYCARTKSSSQTQEHFRSKDCALPKTINKLKFKPCTHTWHRWHLKPSQLRWDKHNDLHSYRLRNNTVKRSIIKKNTIGKSEEKKIIWESLPFLPHSSPPQTSLLRHCNKKDVAVILFCWSKNDHIKNTHIPHNCTFHLPLLL